MLCTNGALCMGEVLYGADSGCVSAAGGTVCGQHCKVDMGVYGRVMGWKSAGSVWVSSRSREKVH